MSGVLQTNDPAYSFVIARLLRFLKRIPGCVTICHVKANRSNYSASLAISASCE